MRAMFDIFLDCIKLSILCNETKNLSRGTLNPAGLKKVMSFEYKLPHRIFALLCGFCQNCGKHLRIHVTLSVCGRLRSPVFLRGKTCWEVVLGGCTSQRGYVRDALFARGFLVCKNHIHLF